MKMVSVKEFRDHATQHLRTTEPIIIMRGASPAGVFLPWDESMLPANIVRKALYDTLVHQLQEQMGELDVSEEEVLADFEAHREDRH